MQTAGAMGLPSDRVFALQRTDSSRSARGPPVRGKARSMVCDTVLTQTLHSLPRVSISTSSCASDSLDADRSSGRTQSAVLPSRNGDYHTKKKDEERDHRRLNTEW